MKQKNKNIEDNNWPTQIKEKYEKISLLGQGSFGGVYLAKTKNKKEENDENNNKVAIKFIDTSTKIAQSYAEREITILSEINHTNIIKLIESIDCVIQSKGSSKCLVLSLAYGPTIDKLIKVGGALGLPISKLICKQLINVVAYLHCHAIMHRDLKPDNLIILHGYSNAQEVEYDDDVWSDDVDTSGKNWKLMLIDFGFARALSANELEKQHKEQQQAVHNNNETTTMYESLNSPLDPTIDDSSSHHNSKKIRINSISNWSIHRKKFKNTQNNIDSSYSKDVLEMSAIGSKGYAAPEIYNGARTNKRYKILSNSSHFGNTYRNALAPCVADYSMSADGFSVGCILRHIYTGVPPNISVEEYVSIQNNPLILLIKYLSYCSSSNNKKRHYKFPRIRYNDEVPKDMIMIIRGLTTSNIKDRLSVRACYRRLFALDNEDGYNNNGNNDDGIINNNNFDVNIITYLKSSTATTTTTATSDADANATTSEKVNENEENKIVNSSTITCME